VAESTPSPEQPEPGAPDLDKLLATLRDRVDQRRNEGVYPPGLEAELDRHFAGLAAGPLSSTGYLLDELDVTRSELEHFEYSRARISAESRLPGGAGVHRAIGKAVGRQVQGLIEQTQDHARVVAHAIKLVSATLGALAEADETVALQRLDDLQLQLAEQRGQLHEMSLRLDDLASRIPGAPIATWYSADAFTSDFRGGPELSHDRYRELAGSFVGCDPVLDIGFGRGEFLELLRDAGVDAWGIEVSPALVDAARNHGLRAEVGHALEYLRSIDDGALGGLVMIQVIEHLSPQHAVDIVKIIADKVRPGGRVLLETVNPTSLYTYAHAFWVDPDHVRPVHPKFLEFLFRQAGFASVQVVDRSPVATDESLELLPGDDETSKRLNANFERINSLLFGPQDYALVAIR
jgi:O-antigen chain-terminating methyltransferase